jgi:hypothetical protein
MLRKLSITSVIAMMIGLSLFVGTASAGSTTNATVSNISYTMSLDNNLVVHKGDPNPMPKTNVTNNTSTYEVCQVYFHEGALASEPSLIAPGATSQIGWGIGFPLDKHGVYNFDLWCGPTDTLLVYQFTATMKFTITGQAG